MYSDTISENGSDVQPKTSRELAALVTRNVDFLRETVRLRMDAQLRPRLDPSDIVQEVQIEALRRADEYLKNPKLPPRLWLRQIAIDRLGMARRPPPGSTTTLRPPRMGPAGRVVARARRDGQRSHSLPK